MPCSFREGVDFRSFDSKSAVGGFPHAKNYFMTAGWADQIAPPREVVEKFGDMKDPATVRGTGPWMVKDYKANVSMTWQKNPDYWGYDELFPDHKFQLPYADEFKQIFINDRFSRLAAIRTARLDVSDALDMNDRGISWEEKESLEKTTDLSFVGYELAGWKSGDSYQFLNIDDVLSPETCRNRCGMGTHPPRKSEQDGRIAKLPHRFDRRVRESGGRGDVLRHLQQC